MLMYYAIQEAVSEKLTSLSGAMQAEANACIIGIIWLDGFGGRCKDRQIT